MVSYEKFKEALVCYMDTDIIHKAPQNRRLLLGAIALVAPSVLDKKIQEYSSVLQTMGIMDSEKMVDDDRLENLCVDLVKKYGRYEMKLFDVSVSIGEEDVRRFLTICRNG